MSDDLNFEKQNPTKALVVLSGGQDSTTCLYWALEEFDEVHCITFDYGQRHAIELKAARTVAAMANESSNGRIKSHEVVSLHAKGDITIPGESTFFIEQDKILDGTSPLVSDNQLEQYADHQSLPGGLEKTFVPMRNQMFLTIAANRAYCRNITNLVTGVCQEDNGGYPDCTAEFIYMLEKACNLGSFTGKDGAPGNLKIHTPLMDLSKAQSCIMALALPGCYEALAFSHTSYDGAYPPTGHDHATLLRAKGFEEATLPDPLVVRAHLEGLMELPNTPNYGEVEMASARKRLDRVLLQR